MSESSSKVGVEDGVDDGVEGAVDVAEPDERRHEPRVDRTRATTVVRAGSLTRRRVANADRVDDVDGKERSPAQQEHRYGKATAAIMGSLRSNGDVGYTAEQ